MNLEFVNIKVRSFSQDFFEVLWEIKDTTLDPLDFQLYVLRSESPEGPFDILAGPFEDKYRFVDNRINPQHKHRQLYYVLRSVAKADPTNVVETHAVSFYPEPDLIAEEIQRLERIVWDEYAGRTCFVFPVRTFGKRCPTCYDGPEKGKGHTNAKRVSHCPTCYDTTYVRGYFDPIKINIQIDPHVASVQPGQLLELQPSRTSARMPNYPLLKPRDLIVEAENIRWRVVQSTPSERLRSVVRQELVLHELARSEIEYQLPIRIEDLRSFDASPARNFTNPQDVEALEEPAIENVFATYRSFT